MSDSDCKTCSLPNITPSEKITGVCLFCRKNGGWTTCKKCRHKYTCTPDTPTAFGGHCVMCASTISQRYGNDDTATATSAISKDGMQCKVCHDFNPYAEANQHDGSYLCRSCRR